MRFCKAIAALAIGVAAGILPLAGPSVAQEQQLDAMDRRWRGAYVGGQFGYAAASAHVQGPPGVDRTEFGPLIGGVFVGYNFLLPSRVLLGIEADVAFPNFLEGDDVVASRRFGQARIADRLDYAASLRARLGYRFDDWMAYVSAGLAWSQHKIGEATEGDDEPGHLQRVRLGLALGAGLERRIDERWSWRLDYLFSAFDRVDVAFPSGNSFAAETQLHSIRVGISRTLSPESERDDATAKEKAGPQSWNVHGQATGIWQGYPAFRSPYEGEKSLKGDQQVRNTGSATAFFGLRIARGLELYLNPEMNQGYGLSAVQGIAGFPNGEAQKSNFPVPRVNMARAYLKQTIGLGGEQETLEDGPNQLASSVDISRLTLIAGKLAVKDFFDNNTYANDPRIGFLNWNMYGGGSYDWTMDKLSWTWGTLAELNQKHWAFRVGYFLVPTVSNANTYDEHVPRRGEIAAELELRHKVGEQPGKVRLFGWLNRATMGSYRESVDEVSGTPDVPDLTRSRRERSNTGVVLNIEQSVTGDLGLFSRASWSPGRTEIIGWTDVHDSLSFGAVLKGTAWGRPDDRIGIAGLTQGLSKEAQRYFAAGGLGIVIGDGQLNYRRENVFETYYALALTKWATFSLDYQFVVNPAYNADRGPVSLYATRVHVEF